MTAPATAAPAVSIAKRTSVCAARDCLAAISIGHRIVKAAVGGWKHEDCARPSFRRARRQRGS